MVDAARAYLPLSALKGFVTLCRLYKLSYLHIHLTGTATAIFFKVLNVCYSVVCCRNDSDDNAFTFPSSAFPELAQGSSWKYKLVELHELQAFAKARNVEIIGEMDGTKMLSD